MNLGVLSGCSCPAGARDDNLRNLVFVGLRGPKNSIIQLQSEIKQRGLENVLHFFGLRNDSNDESVLNVCV